MTGSLADPELAVTKPLRAEDLREACVAEALAMIESEGLDSLSLREVARRLGVPHHWPYKHFPTRDHLVAEIARRAFDHFSRNMDARPRGPGPEEDFLALGRAYIQYAIGFPFYYRLMFSAPLTKASNHPDLIRSMEHVTELLRKSLSAIFAARGLRPSSEGLPFDELFVWSTMHGFVTLTQSHAGAGLRLPAAVCSDAAAHLFGRIGGALGIAPTSLEIASQMKGKSGESNS